HLGRSRIVVRSSGDDSRRTDRGQRVARSVASPCRPRGDHSLARRVGGPGRPAPLFATLGARRAALARLPGGADGTICRRADGATVRGPARRPARSRNAVSSLLCPAAGVLMNLGLMFKAALEMWPATLMCGSLLFGVEAVLGYVLPTFQSQFSTGMLQIEFV